MLDSFPAHNNKYIDRNNDVKLYSSPFIIIMRSTCLQRVYVSSGVIVDNLRMAWSDLTPVACSTQHIHLILMDRYCWDKRKGESEINLPRRSERSVEQKWSCCLSWWGCEMEWSDRVPGSAPYFLWILPGDCVSWRWVWRWWCWLYLNSKLARH